MSKISNHIRQDVIPEGMTQQEVADLLGVKRQTVSRLLNDRVALSESMAYKLQHAFGANAESLLQIQREESKMTSNPANHSMTKNLYSISANDIEHYFSSEKEGQDTLPILIRKLVRAENPHLTKFDFPGENNSQRPGLDGYTHAKEGTKFVPSGDTVWEFGTSKNPARKANSDYNKRTKAKSKKASDKRSKQTFVFVTSKNWPNCKSWADLKSEESEFKEVGCYDASALEQWLEGHPLVQIWFAELRRVDTLNLSTLEHCWNRWSSICDPVLSPKLYENSVKLFATALLDWSRDPSDLRFNIQGNTREEVKAFFGAAKVLTASLLSRPDSQVIGIDRWNLTNKKLAELLNLLDRCVLVGDNADAGRLAISDPHVIPITVTRSATENCLAAFNGRKIIIGFDNDASRGTEPHFRMERSSFDKFQDAMDDMGISYSKSEIISHATHKSPLLVRRYLASSPDSKKPPWYTRLDDNLSKLVPIFLIGAIKTTNEYDKWVLDELSNECCDCNGKQLLRFWRGLARDEEAPVYLKNEKIGIRSPLECLAFLGHLLDEDILDRFFTLCWKTFAPSGTISGNTDNSAQLNFKPNSQRPSELLKRGLTDTIALLAEHGKAHLEGHVQRSVSDRIREFADELLANSSLQDMFELTDYLPKFAEAAPDALLSKIESEVEDIQSSLSECKPDSEERYDLTELLERSIQCLAIIAWNKEYVERACLLLAKISKITLPRSEVDQISNSLEAYSITPIHSLEQILRQFRPCTSASELIRVQILHKLYSEYPDIGFQLSVKEADGSAYFVSDTIKPYYRDWASASNSSDRNSDEQPYVEACYDVLLNHPYTNFPQMQDLLGTVKWFPKKHENALLSILKRWLNVAEPNERVEIFEHIRRIGMNQTDVSETNSTPQKSNETHVDIALLRELCEPTNVIEQHAWLFVRSNVRRPYHEFKDENGKINFKAMREDTERLQLAAMREIWVNGGARGFLDLLKLCKSGYAPSTTLLRIKITDKEIVEVILAVIGELSATGEEYTHHTVLQSALSDTLRRIDGLDGILPLLLDNLEHKPSESEIYLLLKYLPIDSNVLRVLQNRPNNRQYESFVWKNVDVNDITTDSTDIEHFTEKLLEFQRVEEAVNLLGSSLSMVPGKKLASYLRKVSKSLPQLFRTSHEFQNILYKIMSTISKSEISKNELADLEFLYADILLSGGTSYAIPTLAKLSREDPTVFFSLVAGYYSRKDLVQDWKKFRFWDKFDNQTRVGKQCYAILTPINYVFGDSESMIPLDPEKAVTWAEKVVELAERHDRTEITFSHIGMVLGKKTRDRNEMFPDEVARRLFEQFQNQDLTTGWEHGFGNNGPGETTTTYSVSGKNSLSFSNQYQAKADEWAESFPFSSVLMSKMADCFRAKEVK